MASTEGNDMAGMPMNMPMSNMPGMSAGAAADADAPGRTECSFPWSSGDCTDMQSCVPAALSTPLAELIANASPRHEEPAWLAEQLRSISRTPDPPPPRA